MYSSTKMKGGKEQKKSNVTTYHYGNLNPHISSSVCATTLFQPYSAILFHAPSTQSCLTPVLNLYFSNIRSDIILLSEPRIPMSAQLKDCLLWIHSLSHLRSRCTLNKTPQDCCLFFIIPFFSHLICLIPSDLF